MKKRILAMLLAVVMLASLLPTSAFANDDLGDIDTLALEETTPESPYIPEVPEIHETEEVFHETETVSEPEIPELP